MPTYQEHNLFKLPFPQRRLMKVQSYSPNAYGPIVLEYLFPTDSRQLNFITMHPI